MVCKKAFASRLLIVIFSFILVLSFPFTVSAAAGVGSVWDGSVQLAYARPILYLDNTYVMVENPETSEGLTQPYYTLATYGGNQTLRVEIDSDYTDVYLNGSVRKRVSVVPVSQYDTSHLQYLNVYCEPVSLNGVYISTELIEYGLTCVYDVYIEFDNYYVDQSEITLPLNVQYSFTSWYETNRNFNIDEYIWLNMNVSADYAGTIQKYDSLEDVPSLDGYFAEQNQQIIDNSQTQIQNQHTQIQQQEQANQLQQESNEQNKSFMDNFFSNLGNTVLSWIVPSSEQITDFFNEVNSWFSERLGFVWYPFDLAIQLVSAFAGGTADTGFVIPAFSLNFQGQQLNIWNSFEVDIDAFGIFQYVRFFTSALLVCGIVKMAIDKWDEWIGGHNQ